MGFVRCRRAARLRAVVASLAVGLLAGCASAEVSEPSGAGAGGPAGAFSATVERVVDGDTFLARRSGKRLRVRLIGVDAPESVRPDAPVECGGRDASVLLARLLPAGTRVRAAYEAGGRRDRFGRELWDVWLADGRFLQAVLVRHGAVEAVAYEPHVEYAGELAGIEARARADRRGLWGSCER